MLLALLQRYSLKLTFALTLLIGLQLPHFLGQYETRLDAHYLESKTQLSHYQQLADRLYGGDLHALIKQHQRSDNPLFKAESNIIEQLASRVDFLERQKLALKGALYQRLYYLVWQINEPLFVETQNAYQANIVINKESILVGLSVALILTFSLEMLFLLLLALARKAIVQRSKKAIN